LSKAGKPYHGVLFNVHKLIALGTVIVTGMQIIKALKHTDVQVLVIALIIVSGLCVVALFASGGLMSAGKPPYDVLLTIHKIAPLVALLALVVTIYLITGRSQ
jgi:hypothetical protein